MRRLRDGSARPERKPVTRIYVEQTRATVVECACEWVRVHALASVAVNPFFFHSPSGASYLSTVLSLTFDVRAPSTPHPRISRRARRCHGH